MKTPKRRPEVGPMLPEQFFDYYGRTAASQMLWKWLVATVTDGYPNFTPIEKENLFTFYDRLSALLDGIYQEVEIKPTENHEEG